MELINYLREQKKRRKLLKEKKSCMEDTDLVLNTTTTLNVQTNIAISIVNLMEHY